MKTENDLEKHNKNNATDMPFHMTVHLQITFLINKFSTINILH